MEVRPPIESQSANMLCDQSRKVVAKKMHALPYPNVKCLFNPSPSKGTKSALIDFRVKFKLL